MGIGGVLKALPYGENKSGVRPAVLENAPRHLRARNLTSAPRDVLNSVKFTCPIQFSGFFSDCTFFTITRFLPVHPPLRHFANLTKSRIYTGEIV